MLIQMPIPKNSAIATPFEEKLAQYADDQRDQLEQIRSLIHHTASNLSKCGQLVETLKWGQLSFLTEKPKTGTTFRFDANKSGGLSMYVPCSTILIDQYRERIGEVFQYVGNREVVLPNDITKCQNEFKTAIAMALTYHLNK